jgi:hypothetical protein
MMVMANEALLSLLVSSGGVVVVVGVCHSSVVKMIPQSH